MSPEQFQQLLQLFQQGAQGAAAGGGPPGFAQPYRGSKLVSKREQVKWDKLSFIFKRGLRSMSKEVFQKMQETELSLDDIDEGVDLTDEMEERSAELYDILCQYCIGDALRPDQWTTCVASNRGNSCSKSTTQGRWLEDCGSSRKR